MNILCRNRWASFLAAFLLAGCAHHNTLMSRPPYRVLFLGDSITWGQGLSPGHKMNGMLEAAVEASGREYVGVVAAHSGAAIGANQPIGIPGPKDGEVPSTFPTILDQVAKADSAVHYDAIVLSGCINDVGLNAIVDPFIDVRSKVDKRVKQYCHDDLLLLLGKVRQRFPGAKVVVTTYYPILSDQSRRMPSAISWLASLFSTWRHTPASEQQHELSIARITSRNCGVLPSICNVINNAEEFDRAARSAIAAAVDEANSETPNVFVVAEPPIDANHSAYAGASSADSWVWEVRRGPHNTLEAIDEVAPNRTPHCTGDKLTKAFCLIASIGHPNRCGEAAYSSAVIAALGFSWKPPVDVQCAPPTSLRR